MGFLKKIVKKVTKSVSKLLSSAGGSVASLLGMSSPDMPTVPDPAAAEIPLRARDDEATVKLGASRADDEIRRAGKSRASFTSLGGSAGGLNI